MLTGADVSQYQQTIDWPTLKASNRVSFVIMRATYGLTGIDAQFRANQAGARSVGIPCGFYHFADGYDATSEARHFLETVGPLHPGETLWLDDEITLPEHNVWARAFLAVLRPLVVIPGIYSNYSGFRNIGAIPDAIAWIAFPGTPPLSVPAGYTAAQTLLNQTHTAALPGAGSSADIDYLLADSIDVFTSWGARTPDPPTEEDDMLLYQQKNGTVSLLSGGKLINLGAGPDITYLQSLGVKTMLEADITPAFAANILAASADPAPIVTTGQVTGTFVGEVK